MENEKLRVESDHQKKSIAQLKTLNSKLARTLKKALDEKNNLERKFASKIKAFKFMSEQNHFELKEKLKDTSDEKQIREMVLNDEIMQNKQSFECTLNKMKEAHKEKVCSYEDERKTLLVTLGKTIQDADDQKRRYSIVLLDFKKTVNEQKAKIDHLVNENTKLQKSLEDESAKFQKSLESQTEENRMLHSKIETIESDRVTVTCQLLNLRKENAEKISLNKDYEAAVELLKCENDEMIMKNNYCQRKLNLHKKLCRNYKTELDLLKVELGICKDELNLFIEKKNRKCRLRRIMHI